MKTDFIKNEKYVFFCRYFFITKSTALFKISICLENTLRISSKVIQFFRNISIIMNHWDNKLR